MARTASTFNPGNAAGTSVRNKKNTAANNEAFVLLGEATGDSDDGPRNPACPHVGPDRSAHGSIPPAPVTADAVLATLRQFADHLSALAPNATPPNSDADADADADADGALARVNAPAPTRFSDDAGNPAPVLGAQGDQAVQLLRLMLQISDQAEGFACLLAADLDVSRLRARTGVKDRISFLTDQLNVPYWRACRLTELGQGLRDHLPATAHDICAGIVSMENARAIVESMTASQQRIDALAESQPAPAVDSPDGTTTHDPGDHSDIADGDSAPGDHSDPGNQSDSADNNSDEMASDLHPRPTGEQMLLARAAGAKPKSFRDMVAGLAHHIDPEADELHHGDLYSAQYVEIVHRIGGGYAVKGFLDEEAGQLLKTVLYALRKQLPQETREKSEPAHLNALALGMVARLDLEQALVTTKNGAQRHLNVIVDHDTFVRAATSAGVPTDQLPSATAMEPARWADSRGPIPDSTLERMACDSKVARIIFGPESQILNAGDEIRIASAHQRRAVMARDSHCVFPNCTAPPGICEIHHLDEWANDGGPTNIENLALLCWHHHHHIHNQRLKLERHNGAEWKVMRRNQTELPNRC